MEKGKRGNKKKGRKKVLAAAACIGLAAAAGVFFFRQKSSAQAREGVVVIEAGENEEIIYAKIDKITGNDVDVSIVTETASETGEAKSFEIPVGTLVITKLGVETTFSRLSAGNVIALLLEKGTDNILKIWVVS